MLLTAALYTCADAAATSLEIVADGQESECLYEVTPSLPVPWLSEKPEQQVLDHTLHDKLFLPFQHPHSSYSIAITACAALVPKGALCPVCTLRYRLQPNGP
ncbi:hypothetical protein C1N53_08600 [Pontibacter sp. SGAir0037]|nr:hypothetical protein C1N53_08600 [Pontibacter sp. SGAir0037]